MWARCVVFVTHGVCGVASSVIPGLVQLIRRWAVRRRKGSETMWGEMDGVTPKWIRILKRDGEPTGKHEGWNLGRVYVVQTALPLGIYHIGCRMIRDCGVMLGFQPRPSWCVYSEWRD